MFFRHHTDNMYGKVDHYFKIVLFLYDLEPIKPSKKVQRKQRPYGAACFLTVPLPSIPVRHIYPELFCQKIKKYPNLGWHILSCRKYRIKHSGRHGIIWQKFYKRTTLKMLTCYKYRQTSGIISYSIILFFQYKL